MSSTTIRMPQLGESVVEGTVGKWLVSRGPARRQGPSCRRDPDRQGRQRSAFAGVGDRNQAARPRGRHRRGGRSAVRGRSGRGRRSVETGARTEQPERAGSGTRTCERRRVAAAQSSTGGNGRPNESAEHRPPCASSRANRASICRRSRAAAKAAESRATTCCARRCRKRVAPSPSRARRRRPQMPRRRRRVHSRNPQARARSGFRPTCRAPATKWSRSPRRRRIIADHMVYSKLTSPHVVTVAECDLHATRSCASEHKDGSRKRA